MSNIVKFKCPKCGGNAIEEIMADVGVASECWLEQFADGVDLHYGDQINEDGHVERYQCSGCGFTIVNEHSEHADEGLDKDALASALKELNNPTTFPRISFCFQGWVRGADIQSVTRVCDGQKIKMTNVHSDDLVKNLESGQWALDFVDAYDIADKAECEMTDYEVTR